MLYAGIDAGSRAIKVALYDAERRAIVGKGVTSQGVSQPALARGLYERVLAERGLGPDDVTKVVATGYGRASIEFADTTITEITCHATGVRHVHPDAMTIIEIGGQDSKLIRLDEHGGVRDFVMNDRCAAGTGRFMEMVAVQLERSLDDFGMAAHSGVAPATISSMCAVFAETEIVGLLASGASAQAIVAGVHVAVAQRIAAMACRNVTPPVVFTGGVATIAGMAQAIENTVGHPICVVEDPQITGALGAAILASRLAPARV